jgi:hypothetical protein
VAAELLHADRQTDGRKNRNKHSNILIFVIRSVHEFVRETVEQSLNIFWISCALGTDGRTEGECWTL